MAIFILDDIILHLFQQLKEDGIYKGLEERIHSMKWRGDTLNPNLLTVNPSFSFKTVHGIFRLLISKSLLEY